MSDFDWRQSPAHWLFLITFLEARPADKHPTNVDWRLALGEPQQTAVDRFLRDGVVRRLGDRERLDYYLTVKELRALLGERELPVSGNKAELINRLLAADWQGVATAVTGATLLQCSDYGRQLAEEYIRDPERILGRLVEDAPVAAEEGGQAAVVTKETVVEVLKWVVGATTGGVIGNAAYDLLKEHLGRDDIEESLPYSLTRTTTLRVALGLTLEFCYVPAGYFIMGSADRDRDAYDDEKPQHRVYLDAFWLGKYPITNAQYQVFVRATGHRAPYGWEKDRFPRGQGDHPVRNVYWADAVAFCEWAAGASRRPVRLLTEAEWEKGARGTDGRLYPWGNRWLAGRCNTEEAGVGGTTPVGKYPRGASPYGAHDMAGNVYEWTSTLYKPYPYQDDDGREDMSASGARVVRGGSYWSENRWARAAFRPRDDGLRLFNHGFRVGVAAPSSPL